jgi:putative DNA primase/helicase
MTARKGGRATSTNGFCIDPSAPFDVAQFFLVVEFHAGAQRTLHHHQGAFYAWNGTAYLEISEDEIRARLYPFLDQCKNAAGKGEKVKPNTALVSRVYDALKARAELEGRISAPAWFDEDHALPPHEVIACANGLLHLPSLKLLPHTPAFYTHNALDFAFDPDTSAPVQWLEFLGQLWPDDPEPIATLQELFGYCLTGDTSQQKAFLMVGPPRSGKGTIAKVLKRLVGTDNAVNPTLTSLSTNFGIAPLIGKQIAIISDARLDRRANQHAITERLLTITGEDEITADRKFLSVWTGRLAVRFLVISNELPQLRAVQRSIQLS